MAKAYPILSDWDYVRTNAVRLYCNRNDFTYLYGGNGEYIPDRAAAERIVNRLWSQYPSHFAKTVTGTGRTKEDLIQHIIGKRVMDCSALVCYVSQGTDYHALSVKYDMSSGGLITACKSVTTPALGPCGGVLWKPGHVGIDVGGGCFVEAANEFIDIRLRNISEAGFQKSGQLPWVNYTKLLTATAR